MTTAKTKTKSNEYMQEIGWQADGMRQHIELMQAGVLGHANEIGDLARRIADLSAELDKVETKREYVAKEAGWRPAFYDTSYGRDQTERAAIFNKVVEFLLSIGCQPKWSAGHDGSDFDPKYGIHIASVTYKGKTFDHNPCYQVNYELPADLIEKLDAKFPQTNRREIDNV